MQKIRKGVKNRIGTGKTQTYEANSTFTLTMIVK